MAKNSTPNRTMHQKIQEHTQDRSSEKGDAAVAPSEKPLAPLPWDSYDDTNKMQGR